MKIFCEENGRTKVYVQLQDLSLLERTEENVPAWIMSVLWEHSPITDLNRNQFVEFASEEAVQYFREALWIIDYNIVKLLSDEQFGRIGMELNEQLKKLDTMIQNIDATNAMFENDLLNKYMQLESKMKALADVLAMRRGDKKPDFPLVPCYGFKLTKDPYIIRECALDNTLLLSRKDGLELSSNDSIPRNFIENAIAIFIASRSASSHVIGRVHHQIDVSDDNKYLVINFRVLELFEEAPIYPVQKPSIRERIRNIFTKKKND